jgi:hypothetical protein
MNKARNIEEPADASTNCLTWYSGIYPSIPLSLNPALSLSQFRGLDESSISSAANGRLIFLRGYPSAKWLALVGHLFQVGPDYWRHHLDFLSLSTGTFSQERPLPSTRGSLFQMRLGSIGSWGRFWQLSHHSIQTLRKMAADDMERYYNALGDGHGWKQADSVVRQYILHDKEHFSIEQKVTVYLHNESGTQPWTGKSTNN